MKYRGIVTAVLFTISTSCFAAACTGSADDEPQVGSDAGSDGFTLTDTDPTAEAWVVEPTSVEFTTLEVGDFDFRTVTFTNQSGIIQEVTDVALVDADVEIRFATPFIAAMGRPHRWLDLDGDGHSFEVRDNPVEVHAGGSFEVILQYHPTGQNDGCLDPAPASCGFLVLTGNEHSTSIPVFVPR